MFGNPWPSALISEWGSKKLIGSSKSWVGFICSIPLCQMIWLGFFTGELPMSISSGLHSCAGQSLQRNIFQIYVCNYTELAFF